MRVPVILDADPHDPMSFPFLVLSSFSRVSRDNSRVKQEAQQYFAEQEKDMERASREAGAVLRHIEAQARERAGESLVPNFKHSHLAKLQAWGSFRDAMEQYAQLLSSPSKAHPAVAREMEFLRRVCLHSLHQVLPASSYNTRIRKFVRFFVAHLIMTGPVGYQGNAAVGGDGSLSSSDGNR